MLQFNQVISKLQKRVDAYPKFIEEEAIDSSKEFEEETIDANTAKLDQGIDTNGTSLGTYASIAYKGRLQPVDLKLTGDFRGGIEGRYGKKEFELIGTDSKTDELQDKYGEPIIGVPNDFLPELVSLITPDLQDKSIMYFGS